MFKNILPNFFQFKIPLPKPIYEGKYLILFNLIPKTLKIIAAAPLNFNECDEKCPICYDSFYIKVHPNSCSHYFCLRCISEWSKFRKQCPLCRKRFFYII